MLANNSQFTLKNFNGHNTLNSLSALFETLLIEFQSFDFENMKPDIVKESHQKKILIEKETGLGLLLFEAIIFNENIFTGPHTHSEFFIEKVVLGQIEEKQFQKKNNSYHLTDTVIRTSKDQRRAIQCPDFFPHNVRALSGNAHSFCLSLGHQKIQAIDAG